MPITNVVPPFSHDAREDGMCALCLTNKVIAEYEDDPYNVYCRKCLEFERALLAYTNLEEEVCLHYILALI